MADNDLNEVFEEEMEDSDVITVPIDATLTQEGEAADAKAVGDALANKADRSDIVGISVNGESADNQGVILIDGTVIPVNDAEGAPTIAEAMEAVQDISAETVTMSDEDDTTVAEAIAEVKEAADAAVKTVNGTAADENGDVAITEVLMAQNLTSDQSQDVTGAFVIRTTGGSRSVGSGSAQVQEIRGAMKHTGQVQEVLEMNVDETSGITVSIDRDTFVAYVDESGELVFTYDSAWKLNGSAADLTDYGLTVTGSPENGDTITITFVKGERGEITVATPTAIKATGWNLFNPSTGYARVAGYDGAYHVGGSYTAMQYSVTLNGEKSSITVQNSSFTVPGDGFVWVTGGDATTTYITTEWTDWTAGPGVPWEAYTESVISIAAIMTAQFPYGLMAVGAVYDSISIDQGKYYSRIERIDYDPDDLAEIISQGRAYEADENYIYVVKTSATSGSISISGNMTVNDHGIETVEGTDVGPVTVILYGQNLKAKLVNDVVTLSQQTLTEEQKTQVLANIGVNELFNKLMGLYVVEAKTIYDNKTIAAGGYDDSTVSVAKTGYKVDSVAGYNVANGSSSGAGRTNVALPKLYTSGTNLVVCAKNLSSASSIKIKLIVYIRYKKEL